MQEGIFELLTPPWENARVLERQGSYPNTALPKKLKIETRFIGVKNIWDLEHVNFIEGQEFSDLLLSGPFSYYKHRHLMKSLSEKESLLIDQIEFQLPFGFIGNFFGYPVVKYKFDKVFAYRHQITKNALES